MNKLRNDPYEVLNDSFRKFLIIRDKTEVENECIPFMKELLLSSCYSNEDITECIN